jgi:dimethylhistidine N-methyltransferase
VKAVNAIAADVNDIAADVRAGLGASPKHLPCHLLYDSAGSSLFEAITELPEYYLTRTELAILEAHAGEIAAAAGGPRTVAELGAGTATKTRTILDAVRPAIYVPIDVSASALEVAAAQLSRPGLEVRPLVGRYQDLLPRLAALPGPRLLLFIGSSIGNYEPQAAVALLAAARRCLAPGDAFLLGADLRKSEDVLVPAYNDAAGVTARFTRNLLARLNRELGARFDLESFRHLAIWNPERSRMEIYLESLRDQRVEIPALGMVVSFARGERIHTENSYKLPLAGQLRLLRDAGFSPAALWRDAREYYAVHLARVPAAG